MSTFQTPSPTPKTSAGTSKASPTSRPPVRKAPPAVVKTTPFQTEKNINAVNKKSTVPKIIVNKSSSPQISSPSGTPGKKLPTSIREALEKSLHVDLETVKVHQDAAARKAAGSMSARAFTYGSDIYLGPGEKETDLALMGHEAAHVIQQQNVSSVQQLSSTGKSNIFEREAHAASQAVVQGRSFNVQSRVSSPVIQKKSLMDGLDGIASLAAALPGFTLLTFIVGFNPITLKKVERNFTNLLHSFLGLFGPLGEGLFQILKKYEIIEKVGTWLEKQVGSLGITFNDLKQRFENFTDSLSLSDIFNADEVWERGKRIFYEPIQRCSDFCSKLIDQAITWLKETFMGSVKNICNEIPGYKLISVLLGKDPFTGEAVDRSAINVVTAFAEFIPGGTERVQQLVESKSIQKVYEWFMAETKARNLTWDRISGTFLEVWNSLKIENVLQPVETFNRVKAIAEPLVIDLVGFAKASLIKLLEIMFEIVMSSGGARILAILKKGRDAFLMIIRDPVRFLKNLLGAVGQGIKQFMSKILVHLKEGVIAWLVGPVAQAGVQMPEQWDLKGIIWFVLQILGLTWERVREKLVKLMGPGVVDMLEKGFQLIQEIRQKGIVQALKDRVEEFFGQIKEAALGSIKSFIQERLVVAGITQLLSMLSPVGAVIQSIIKTYTTIKFFIDKINQMLEFVESIVNSIASIAAGAIGAAANFIEKTMAKTIPLILDFLARFIGLGNVGEHVQKTIKKLQAGVDGMLDKAVEWIKNMAKNVASKALGGDPKAPSSERVKNALKEAVPLINKYAGKKVGAKVLRVLLAPLKVKYQLTILDVKIRDGVWAVEAAASPGVEQKTEAEVEITDTGSEVEEKEKPASVANTPAPKTITPIVKYKTQSINVGGLPCRVGQEMTADYLSPYHKQGTGPGGELDGIFEYLPTDGKVTDKSKDKVFIRGHLLNDNLGGLGEDYNLFPITGTANKQHESSIESIVKTAVNEKGLFAFYSVKIKDPKITVTNLEYNTKKLYEISSDIDCSFCTYVFKNNEFKKKDPLIQVLIKSKYNQSGDIKPVEKPQLNEMLDNTSLKLKDFKIENVKLAKRHKRKSIEKLMLCKEAIELYNNCKTPHAFAIEIGKLNIPGIKEKRQMIIDTFSEDDFKEGAEIERDNQIPQIVNAINDFFKNRKK
jgi:hypothetical protein